MKPDLDPIPVQMRAARQQLGWSLADAEEKTGIPIPVTGSWERGERNPTLPALRRWAAAYGRTLVMLEPGERVVSTVECEGEEFVAYVVTYGTEEHGGVIDCPSEAEARNIAASIPGARVGYRVMRRSPIFLVNEASR